MLNQWLTFVCEKRVALNPVAHSIRAKDADESDNSLQEEQKTQMDEHTPITAQYFTYPDRLTAVCISQHAGWMDGAVMVVVVVSRCCSVMVVVSRCCSVLCHSTSLPRWAATPPATSQAHDAGLHQTQNNSHDPSTIASHLIFIWFYILCRYLM